MTKPARLLTDGFRCECWTHDPATSQPRKQLGSIDVETAHQAVRWIRIAARTLASALDEEAFTETWAWLSDGYQDTLQALTKGEPCTLTVHDSRTTIRWTAHPVRYLKLSTRQGITSQPAWRSTPSPKNSVSNNFLYGFKARARRGRAPPLRRGLPPPRLAAPGGALRACGQR